MLGLTLSNIILLINQYGYIILFPISIIEGPIVSVIAGFLVSVSSLNGIVVFFILMAGDLVGDTLYYILGLASRHGFVIRWGKYVGITTERVTKLEKYFKRHDWKILLIGKTQPIGSAILFTAGMIKMPLKKFIGYNLLASVPKVLLFEFAGFYLGRVYGTLDGYTDNLAIIFGTITFVLITIYIMIKRYLRSTNPDLQT